MKNSWLRFFAARCLYKLKYFLPLTARYVANIFLIFTSALGNCDFISAENVVIPSDTLLTRSFSLPLRLITTFLNRKIPFMFVARVSALGKISLTCGPANVLLTTETPSLITTASATDFLTTVTMANYANEDNENSNERIEVPEPKAVSSSGSMNCVVSEVVNSCIHSRIPMSILL